MIYLITFILFILEIFIFCCSGIIFAYSPYRRVSESASLGIILALILISLIFQTAFLLEHPNFSILIESLLSLIAIRYITQNYLIIKKAFNSLHKFILNNKAVSLIVGFCWLYLLCLVTIIPPANWDSMAYNLGRIFLFQQEKSLYLENFTTIRQSMFVVGADILNYGFLRLGKDYGVGLFSWLAYISAGLGTYGLSRSFTSHKISLTSALIVISLTEFCFQATSTKNDIFTAVSAVFCFIVGDRALTKPNAKNLAMLLLGIAFGFSAKTTFLGFLAPFGLCFGTLVLVKFGWQTCYKIIIHNWLYLVILTAPILIISQTWLFFNNVATAGDLTGGNSIKIVRTGNIEGGIANLVRYLFQSIHLFPVDYALRGRLGINIGEYLTEVYNQVFYPFFGNAGMGYIGENPYNFVVTVIPYEDFAWYGPLGFIIVVPATIFTLLKGNFWLKAQSISLIGFILIVSYKLHWTPWNNRYLSLFFVASGACVAFSLQHLPRKYQSRILNGIISISLILLISACIINVSKPLGGLSITEFFKPNIWSKTNFGRDRLYYGNKHYRDGRIEKFRDLVPNGSKIALLADKKSWIYHFYLVHPQSTIVPTSLDTLKDEASSYDYLLCLDVECNLNQLESNYKELWTSPNKDTQPAKIIKLIK